MEISFDERPLLAIWEVTQACDLVCAHCRACATPCRDPLELSAQEGKALLGRLAALRVPLVVLTGGDPAKREDLVELVEHGAGLGLSMAVTPSGTPLMTRELMGRLKRAGLSRLAVSVDGPSAGVHDAFRGVEGSFEESLRILRQGAELGIPLQVNTSVGPHNGHLIEPMAALVRAVQAALWSVFFVVPTGRATGLEGLDREGTERLLEKLADVAAGAPFEVKTTAAPQFRRVLMQRKAQSTRLGVYGQGERHGGPRGINDGCGFLFVSHQGDIFPSGFLPFAAGNVRRDDVGEVYRHHPAFARLREVDALQGKCGVCPFRWVCGGSRSRAFAVSGDMMGEDPLCAYVPRGWQGAS